MNEPPSCETSLKYLCTKNFPQSHWGGSLHIDCVPPHSGDTFCVGVPPSPQGNLRRLLKNQKHPISNGFPVTLIVLFWLTHSVRQSHMSYLLCLQTLPKRDSVGEGELTQTYRQKVCLRLLTGLDSVSWDQIREGCTVKCLTLFIKLFFLDCLWHRVPCRCCFFAKEHLAVATLQCMWCITKQGLPVLTESQKCCFPELQIFSSSQKFLSFLFFKRMLQKLSNLPSQVTLFAQPVTLLRNECCASEICLLMFKVPLLLRESRKSAWPCPILNEPILRR